MEAGSFEGAMYTLNPVSDWALHNTINKQRKETATLTNISTPSWKHYFELDLEGMNIRSDLNIKLCFFANGAEEVGCAGTLTIPLIEWSSFKTKIQKWYPFLDADRKSIGEIFLRLRCDTLLDSSAE